MIRSVSRSFQMLGRGLLISLASMAFLTFSMGFMVGGASVVHADAFEYERINDSTASVHIVNNSTTIQLEPNASDRQHTSRYGKLGDVANTISEPFETPYDDDLARVVSSTMYRTAFGSANAGVRTAKAFPAWFPTQIVGMLTFLGGTLGYLGYRLRDLGIIGVSNE